MELILILLVIFVMLGYATSGNDKPGPHGRMVKWDRIEKGKKRK